MARFLRLILRADTVDLSRRAAKADGDPLTFVPRALDRWKVNMAEAKIDSLIMSVRLASDDFESSVTIRMDASEADKLTAIERWLKLAHTGLQIGATNIVADLSNA